MSETGQWHFRVAQVDPAGTHVALKVKDLNLAIHFYHDLVGLPILRKMGPADKPSAVWLPGVQLIPQGEDFEPSSHGNFDHVGIAIGNLEEVCARLDRADCQADQPLGKSSYDEWAREGLSAFYRDFEGNRVELFHWL